MKVQDLKKGDKGFEDEPMLRLSFPFTALEDARHEGGMWRCLCDYGDQQVEIGVTDDPLLQHYGPRLTVNPGYDVAEVPA